MHPSRHSPGSPATIDESIAFLATPEALDRLRADPYWPKWDGPWWQATLLWELGHARSIPGAFARGMVAALETHYLPDFPQEHELPAGADPYRHVICHCAVGTMFQVLHACGVDVDDELPWMREWLYRYQMPDGGLNCDERAYARAGGKSSIVSTAPALEAILRCSQRPLDRRAAQFLERGATYLIEHRLLRRATGNSDVIDHEWLRPTFPRYYFYDILRGLTFLAEWAEVTETAIPRSSIEESVTILSTENQLSNGVRIGRRAASVEQPTMLERDGDWKLVRRANTFPLLDSVAAPGRISPELTGELQATLQRLERLELRGLLASR